MVREACRHLHVTEESQLLHLLLCSFRSAVREHKIRAWDASRNKKAGATNALVFLAYISFSSKNHLSSFNKYLLNVFFVRGAVAGPGDKE